MSLKQSTSESKSLKGMKLSQQAGAQIDMRALLAAFSTAGVVLTNVTLQNMIALSGMMDDVVIGSLMPSSGIFTRVEIGLDQDGLGGQFVVYGNKSSILEYDVNGNVVASTSGDSMSWDPETAILNIAGGLQVRDPARFGNIQIRKNRVEAIAPEDNGNVELYPFSSNGYITIGGNIAQNLFGTVQFNLAKEISFDSRDTSIIN